MSNFSRNARTNAIINGSQPADPAIRRLQEQYLSSNSTNDDDQNRLARLNNMDSSQDNTYKPTQEDISSYLDQAKQSLQEGQRGGITQDQLDALHKHEGVNMWTSLFMNLIGASHGLNSKQAMEPLNRKLEEERSGLDMQNKLAQQKFSNAEALQGFGSTQLKLGNQIDQQRMMQSPISSTQRSVRDALKKLGYINTPDDSDNLTQMQYEREMPDLKTAADLAFKQKQQEQNEVHNRAQSEILVPVKNEDGSIGYSLVSKESHKSNPIENSVLPQELKMGQQTTSAITKAIKPEIMNAHLAIQNYETALEGLTPEEAKQADSLARRQIGAIAGKFDQGVKPNSITNLNQLFNTVAKLEQTPEFNTPNNPAIGEAAFRRVKSALEFAVYTQAGKQRPSNFSTQLGLGSSFGANLPFQEVPSEKIEELMNQTKSRVGGSIQSALSSVNDREVGEKVINELFNGSEKDYLNSYHKIHGPGYKGSNEKKEVNKSETNKSNIKDLNIMSSEDYLNSLDKK